MATAVVILRLIAVLLFAFATFGFNPPAFGGANLVALGLCLWCLAGLLPSLRASWPPSPTTHSHP